jgi:hypothetical protein
MSLWHLSETEVTIILRIPFSFQIIHVQLLVLFLILTAHTELLQSEHFSSSHKPDVVKREGKFYCFYSANGNSYKLVLLRTSTTKKQKLKIYYVGLTCYSEFYIKK